ncbi:MAG: hypothetical protein ILM98_02215 [Kiritimatiellae bacterium]|nr:hypothetical protein [Kiritimatiellia bacterium]
MMTLCALIAVVAAAALGGGAAFASGMPIVDGFAHPPKSCAVQTWWHWMDDCVTREGIERDLKAMADAGISTAYVFAPRMSNLPTTAKTMSPEWLDLFAFAIAEAKKNGMELGFHNCPGWSSSGGPWIAPEDSMKCIVSSSRDVTLSELGECGAALALPPPPQKRGFFHDIRLFAFPALLPPSLVNGSVPDNIPLAKDDAAEYVLEYAEPFAPSVAVFDVAIASFYMAVDIFAEVNGQWERRGGKDFKLFRSEDIPKTVALGEGMPASRWKICFRALRNPPWIRRTDIPIRSVELGNFPFMDSRTAIAQEELVDLGNAVSGDEVDVAKLLPLLPAEVSQTWRILRVGYTTTGGGPAPATVGGLECDKLDRRGLTAHWKAMPARILALPDAREVVRHVVIDSYEVGKQTWTESLPDEFRRRTGHEIWPVLPAVLGYRVESDSRTTELRKAFDGVIADLFAENYYDYFAELCHAAGVKAVMEPYGGPFDSMRCGREADVPTCEFWLGRPLSHSVGKAVDIARKYGKNIVAAEAFTTEAREGRWQATPAQLRRAGDEAWAAGVNQLVYHSYVHQPYIDKAPGSSLGRHGTQLNVNTTWWPQMRVWTDYVRRGQFLLQYGRIAMDRYDIVPGKIEALVRTGDGDERIWFVRNKTGERVREKLQMDCAAGLPVCEFDAVHGRIYEVANATDGVDVDLSPGESRFFVFAAGLKGERRPAAGKEIIDLSHGWTIAAFNGLAAPEAPIAADPLFDWSKVDDERLRYFSGTADYVLEGSFPAGILDLGDVREVAEIRVDGRLVGTLAYHPFQIEVPSGSKLEVRVVNTWPNRLIGDAIRRSRGEEPYAWSNWLQGWSADDKPLPAGLLGPVKILLASPPCDFTYSQKRK